MSSPWPEQYAVRPIGYTSSCFPEKFGTPRQPGLAPAARGAVNLVEPFNSPACVNGLQGFSHIWLHFIFHQALEDGWKATIRPPRLDGRSRKGVFATRSPHRPNHIGLSVVELLDIEIETSGVRLIIGGLDLVHGTPVIDIKPYIPEVEAIVEAAGGWLEAEFPALRVSFTPESAAFCRDYEIRTGRRLTRLIEEVLEHDPRPASQRQRKTHYGMTLWDVNVDWRIDGSECLVIRCVKSGRTP